MTSRPRLEPRSLSPAEKLDWLRLIRSDNIGPITFFKLLEAFPSANAALDALPGLSSRGGRKKPLKAISKAETEREMEDLDKAGVQTIAWIEPEYPSLLAHIEDPPPLIFVRGHAHLLSKACVGVVGSRNASLNGQKLAFNIAADLGRGGLLVASGLARGIDTAAHKGSLETGTVAVMAGGVDVIYPSENEDLYQNIVERGAVMSEMKIGTQPTQRHFPRRNRMISGMSRGVAVIEAAVRSGSLITARMALEQNREVFAVPGNPSDPRSRGSNDLIRQGAHLLESAGDILSILKERYTTPLSEREHPGLSAPSDPVPSDAELDKARRIIEENIGFSPTPVDEIIRNCQVSRGPIAMILLELELAGRLERHPGNRVSIIQES
jgi:DNA processing protein